jgi:hypothetical protein
MGPKEVPDTKTEKPTNLRSQRQLIHFCCSHYTSRDALSILRLSQRRVSPTSLSWNATRVVTRQKITHIRQWCGCLRYWQNIVLSVESTEFMDTLYMVICAFRILFYIQGDFSKAI